MITIAIIDDNQMHAEDIKKLLLKYMQGREYSVDVFESGTAFFATSPESHYDIAFLDIILGAENGIDIGEQLIVRCPDTKIIFVSSEISYFKDVYRVPHVYFLTKDLEEVRFADAMEKILRLVEKRYITVPVKHDGQKLLLKDIVHIEGYGGSAKFYMSDGSVKEYHVNIKKIEQLLPKEDFVRTHQSFIVNMHHIQKYSRQTLWADNRREIPISRAYIQSVREKISLFLGDVI